MILLIHPPLVKPSEPPPGIARLAGAMRAQGVECSVIDANVEGLLHLLGLPSSRMDTWTRRAVKNAARNLSRIRDERTYRVFDRYVRTVMDLNRVLATVPGSGDTRITLSDFETGTLSPLKSADLVRAAEHPERNPFYGYFRSRLASTVEASAPSIVGFSLNYLSQAPTTFAMIGFMRSNFPGIAIVLGGGLVTSWVSALEGRNPFKGLVNKIVAGPGEGPLLALAGLPGDFSGDAPPDYADLPLGDYLSPGIIMPFASSTGCYWGKCTFCPERAEGTRYSGMGQDRALEQMDSLVRRYDPALVHVVDNAIPPALLAALARNGAMRPWYGFARCTGELADGDFCRALKKSGCVMLKLGIESGDQAVLDGMEKGLTVETSSRVLTSLKQAGIAVYAYLLFGTPFETESAAGATLDFVARHADAIAFLNTAVFNLPRNSPDTERLETFPFSDDDLSLYVGFRHPAGWDRGKVRRFVDRAFRRHRSVAPILRADPPFFTSNHAPFFTPHWKSLPGSL